MDNLKKPKEKHRELKTLCSSVVIEWVPRLVIIVLLVTGYKILLEYSRIFRGFPLTEVQKMALDYSLTIFAGSAVFLLAYLHEMKKIVNQLFNIKEVEYLNEDPN